MPGYRRSGSSGGGAGGERGRGTPPEPRRTPTEPAPPRRATRPPRDEDEADYQLPGDETEESLPGRAGSTQRRGRVDEDDEPSRRSRHRRPARPEQEEIEGPERLADLAAEFLSLALQIRDGGEVPEAAALGRKLDALFQEMAERAAEARIPSADVDHARYALAALIDETILNSPSATKEDWAAAPLQMRYFNENTAGEGFFDRVEQLRRTRGGREALEVYYLCLALGFQGRYRMLPSGELAALIDSLRQELVPPSRRGGGAPPLAPSGARPDAADEVPKRQLPLYPMAAGFVAVVVLVLILVAHSLGLKARAQAARLKAMAVEMDKR